jgi:hypothetical protein
MLSNVQRTKNLHERNEKFPQGQSESKALAAEIQSYTLTLIGSVADPDPTFQKSESGLDIQYAEKFCII